MIITSTYTVGNPQIDARKYVTEEHVDSLGVIHRVEYLAEVGANYQAALDAHALQISNQLAEEEATQIIG